jgi:hypothetical protein
MSNAATLSAPTPPPDTSRAAVRTFPPGVAHLLAVVRILIEFACDLAAKAEECAVRGDIGPVAMRFYKGIQIDALIIRIARGLRRALALQEMLLQRAAEGRDIAPVDPAPSSGGGGSKRDGQDKDKPPKPERLPSVAEIAAEIGRRPPGAIIADICNDIGITPGDLTDAQWEALEAAINEYGGSLMKLWPAMRNRLVAEMEAFAADPLHTPPPRLPLIPVSQQPWLRQPASSGAHPP